MIALAESWTQLLSSDLMASTTRFARQLWPVDLVLGVRGVIPVACEEADAGEWISSGDAMPLLPCVDRVCRHGRDSPSAASSIDFSLDVPMPDSRADRSRPQCRLEQLTIIELAKRYGVLPSALWGLGMGA